MLKLLRQTILIMIFAIIGFMLGAAYQTTNEFSTPIQTGGYELPNNPITGAVASLTGVPERDGPADRVPEKAIMVYSDRVVLDIQNAQWSTFTDTNSMDPVLDKGANAIQVTPKNPDDIQIGDIISYKSEYSDGVTIHRVVAKGTDEVGPYYLVKGDNLPNVDPGKVRFSQILRVLVAIIY